MKEKQDAKLRESRREQNSQASALGAHFVPHYPEGPACPLSIGWKVMELMCAYWRP